MKQRQRLLIALILLLAIIGLVLGVDWLQRRPPTKPRGTATPLPAGSIPIYLDGRLVAGFLPGDLDKLGKVSFTETVEGKLQEGWLLRNVILLHIPAQELTPEMVITVTSTSRNKSAHLAWDEVQNPANMVMFDLSNRGTLKLVSLLPTLDTREEWVQDADRIEISTP
jgi:hypothetical protein